MPGPHNRGAGAIATKAAQSYPADSSGRPIFSVFATGLTVGHPTVAGAAWPPPGTASIRLTDQGTLLYVINPPTSSDLETDWIAAQPHFFGLIDGYEDVTSKAFRKVAAFPDERMRRAGLGILTKLRNAIRHRA